MSSNNPSMFLVVCLLAAMLSGGATKASATPPGGSYEDLVSFFKEWREFQKPRLVDGVPDYSAGAMAEQHRELAGPAPARRDRPDGWPVPQQVDWHVVRAEMNGLDFDHRVLQPWANNPAFYVTFSRRRATSPRVRARSPPAPSSSGAPRPARTRAPRASAPASAPSRSCSSRRRRTSSATAATSGSAARGASGSRARTSAFASRSPVPGRTCGRGRARAKGDRRIRRLARLQAALKTGPSGVGVENYDWYLQHVQLVPLDTWQDSRAHGA